MSAYPGGPSYNRDGADQDQFEPHETPEPPPPLTPEEQERAIRKATLYEWIGGIFMVSFWIVFLSFVAYSIHKTNKEHTAKVQKEAAEHEAKIKADAEATARNIKWQESLERRARNEEFILRNQQREEEEIKARQLEFEKHQAKFKGGTQP